MKLVAGATGIDPYRSLLFGPLDPVVVDVVASLQQKSAGSQQLNHGMQVVTVGQHQFVCFRTRQLKMLDCCLHWHC
jgi:hypothetical protein